jgi:hypothetical protein
MQPKCLAAEGQINKWGPQQDGILLGLEKEEIGLQNG